MSAARTIDALPAATGETRARLLVLGRSLLWLIASYAALVLLWAVGATWIDNPVLLPGPAEVLTGFGHLIADRSLIGDIAASLQRVFAGFFIAVVLAVPVALVMSHVRITRQLLLPIITLLRPIPPIAWIPIAILWFGIGNAPSYFITAIAAFFPIFLNSFAGGMAVEDRHLHAARFMGARQVSLFLRIILPSALPHIWTGLKVGLGQSWMAVVAAELVAAQSGLGYMIQINRINLETGYVMVGMASIGILGSLMTAGLTYIERFVLPWKVK